MVLLTRYDQVPFENHEFPTAKKNFKLKFIGFMLLVSSLQQVTLISQLSLYVYSYFVIHQRKEPSKLPKKQLPAEQWFLAQGIALIPMTILLKKLPKQRITIWAFLLIIYSGVVMLSSLFNNFSYYANGVGIVGGVAQASVLVIPLMEIREYAVGNKRHYAMFGLAGIAYFFEYFFGFLGVLLMDPKFQKVSSDFLMPADSCKNATFKFGLFGVVALIMGGVGLALLKKVETSEKTEEDPTIVSFEDHPSKKANSDLKAPLAKETRLEKKKKKRAREKNKYKQQKIEEKEKEANQIRKFHFGSSLILYLSFFFVERMNLNYLGYFTMNYEPLQYPGIPQLLISIITLPIGLALSSLVTKGETFKKINRIELFSLGLIGLLVNFSWIFACLVIYRSISTKIGYPIWYSSIKFLVSFSTGTVLAISTRFFYHFRHMALSSFLVLKSGSYYLMLIYNENRDNFTQFDPLILTCIVATLVWVIFMVVLFIEGPNQVMYSKDAPYFGAGVKVSYSYGKSKRKEIKDRNDWEISDYIGKFKFGSSGTETGGGFGGGGGLSPSAGFAC